MQWSLFFHYNTTLLCLFVQPRSACCGSWVGFICCERREIHGHVCCSWCHRCAAKWTRVSCEASEDTPYLLEWIQKCFSVPLIFKEPRFYYALNSVCLWINDTLRVNQLGDGETLPNLVWQPTKGYNIGRLLFYLLVEAFV